MNARNVGLNGSQPTVISTFAGCGGSSLGYKLAGFRELLAVEWNDDAVKTFGLNFPDVPIYHGDISNLTGSECMRLANIKPGDLDVLDGSPPCQGFSMAGKRKFDDPRNSLFREYTRLLSELQPRAFIMENVTGMIKGAMKQAYLAIITTLRNCGYQCKGEVLNAMYFNVPQSRERVIIIGVRNDIGKKPSHPKPQTKPKTVKEAIYDLRHELADLPFNTETRMAQVMLNYVKPGGYDPKHFGHHKETWNKPAATLRRSAIYAIWHPDANRPLTLKEWKRLSSFPDDFIFLNKKSGCMLIGNSVPPNLMRAIAEHIRQEILGQRRVAHD